MTQDSSSQDKKFNFSEFEAKYVNKFLPQYYLFFPEHGYVVWRFGTGENIELLHIRSFKPGYGQKIIAAMINELKKNPPFYSVFGFALKANTAALKMYSKAGFNLADCPYPYKGGPATIFSQSFEILCKKDFSIDSDMMNTVIKSKNLK